jgi:hypothetical protein
VGARLSQQEPAALTSPGPALQLPRAWQRRGGALITVLPLEHGEAALGQRQAAGIELEAV